MESAAAHLAEAFKILGGDRIIEAAKFFMERNSDQLPDKPAAEVVEELLAAKEARKKSDRCLQGLRARHARFAAR